ncbi:hypothetical protein JXB02_01390 [Candidatus Woesearchaeota archaeon]|nr:hypothetical protein [Candidatus Woesearchaeota archaeon]
MGRIMPLMLAVLLLAGSASALTLSVNQTRVYYPSPQELTIDLGKGILAWEDVVLDVTVEGQATFSDGTKERTYEFENLSKNILLKEVIILRDFTGLEQQVNISGEVRYTALYPLGFSKDEISRDTTEFLGIWADRAACQDQLSQCESAERLLEDQNDELKAKIDGLETRLGSVESEKASLQLMLDNQTLAIQRLEARPPEKTNSWWLFIISLCALILVVLFGLAYVKALKLKIAFFKESKHIDRLEGKK